MVGISHQSLDLGGFNSQHWFMVASMCEASVSGCAAMIWQDKMVFLYHFFLHHLLCACSPIIQYITVLVQCWPNCAAYLTNILCLLCDVTYRSSGVSEGHVYVHALQSKSSHPQLGERPSSIFHEMGSVPQEPRCDDGVAS